MKKIISLFVGNTKEFEEYLNKEVETNEEKRN